MFPHVKQEQTAGKPTRSYSSGVDEETPRETATSLIDTIKNLSLG
jgi:hypothetical protein